jgi:SAM-dependent methyltransferase
MQLKNAKRPCPICDNPIVQSLHTQRFVLPDGHPLMHGYEVVCCEYCGFVYADTTIPQEVYDAFYAQYSKYEDKLTSTGGVENKWDRERIENTAYQIADYIQDLNCSVLDIGCANGGLLRFLMDIGYVNLLGIDPSPVCVENTRRLGVNAEVGSLTHAPLHAQFDCVVLSHTMEHVQDLRRAAGFISASTAPEAVIYVEVPDASRYQDFIDAPFQDFNTEHINHFSITSLKNFLLLNGFSPLVWGEKVIPASENKPYPAIFCFAKKVRAHRNIEKDYSLRTNIESYIKRSSQILDEIDGRIKEALACNNRLFVWGTGQLTMKLLAETSLADADIIAFVDSNPINQGKMLHGRDILAPDDLHKYSEAILISSTLHQQSIVKQIRKMGLQNQLIMLKDA